MVLLIQKGPIMQVTGQPFSHCSGKTTEHHYITTVHNHKQDSNKGRDGGETVAWSAETWSYIHVVPYVILSTATSQRNANLSTIYNITASEMHNKTEESVQRYSRYCFWMWDVGNCEIQYADCNISSGHTKVFRITHPLIGTICTWQTVLILHVCLKARRQGYHSGGLDTSWSDCSLENTGYHKHIWAVSNCLLTHTHIQ